MRFTQSYRTNKHGFRPQGSRECIAIKWRPLILSLFVTSDQLKQHYNLGKYCLEVDLEDLSSYDETLADKLNKNPAEFLPLVCKNILYESKLSVFCHSRK